MCEYCGCQSLATVDELTREHGTVVDLIGRVREAHREGAGTHMAELAAAGNRFRTGRGARGGVAR